MNYFKKSDSGAAPEMNCSGTQWCALGSSAYDTTVVQPDHFQASII